MTDGYPKIKPAAAQARSRPHRLPGDRIRLPAGAATKAQAHPEETMMAMKKSPFGPKPPRPTPGPGGTRPRSAPRRATKPQRK